MSNLYSVTPDNDVIRVKVSGELSYSTVKDILHETETLFDPVVVLHLDLGTVTHSDSAGLALLVHWIRQAESKYKKLVLHNVPAPMLAMAAISGLDELLPLA